MTLLRQGYAGQADNSFSEALSAKDNPHNLPWRVHRTIGNLGDPLIEILDCNDDRIVEILEVDHPDFIVRAVNAHAALVDALEIILTQYGPHEDGQGAAKFHAVNIASAALEAAKEPSK